MTLIPFYLDSEHALLCKFKSFHYQVLAQITKSQEANSCQILTSDAKHDDAANLKTI